MQLIPAVHGKLQELAAGWLTRVGQARQHYEGHPWVLAPVVVRATRSASAVALCGEDRGAAPRAEEPCEFNMTGPWGLKGFNQSNKHGETVL